MPPKTYATIGMNLLNARCTVLMPQVSANSISNSRGSKKEQKTRTNAGTVVSILNAKLLICGGVINGPSVHINVTKQKNTTETRKMYADFLNERKYI